MLINLFDQTKNVLEVGVATLKKPLLVLGLGLLLSACGQKSPVYLPTAAQQQALDERADRIKARKEALRNETPEQKATREARLEYGRQRAEEYRKSQEALESSSTQD